MNYTDKEKKIKSELERLLPGVITNSIRAGNSDEVFHSHLNISPENNNLVKSKYFYKEELKFIHFSSIYALQNILKNKTIRLYNLYNLNDPREYSFAGDLLTFNKERREDAKSNMHLISMCKSEILEDKPEYEFNMWRLYGQNGNGVCIEFDFSLNPLKHWRDYFLSEVFYGSRSRKDLIKINQVINKYESEKPKIEIDLGQIVAFHKSNLYKLEKEVRLLFDNREKKVLSSRRIFNNDNTLLSPIIENDLTKSISLNNNIKYLELPIYSKWYTEVSHHIPNPKIIRVILGYSYRDRFEEVSKNIKELADRNLGYSIVIELSRLARYYYEK